MQDQPPRPAGRRRPRAAAVTLAVVAAVASCAAGIAVSEAIERSVGHPHRAASRIAREPRRARFPARRSVVLGRWSTTRRDSWYCDPTHGKGMPPPSRPPVGRASHMADEQSAAFGQHFHNGSAAASTIRPRCSYKLAKRSIKAQLRFTAEDAVVNPIPLESGDDLAATHARQSRMSPAGAGAGAYRSTL